MDLRELTAFHTILREGTFSRAAEKLNYAQSTITNQIQRLEKELGVTLFKRGWEAELTDAGRVFATEVERLIRHWSDVAQLAKGLQLDEIGSLRVGGIESAMERVLPGAVRALSESRPRIACQVVMGNTDSLSRSLLQDELDLAICGEPSDPPSSLRFEPLYEERIVFVADGGHPLLERTGVGFEDLLGYPLIAGGQNCLYYLPLAKRLSRYEGLPPIVNTVTPISSIPGFVRGTRSIGVVLGSTPLPPDVRTVKASWEDPVIPIGLLRPRDRDDSPASSKQMLMRMIREEIAKARV